MSSNHDTLIIGAGLTGLMLTHRLHQAGHRVSLLEARETLGGRFRRPSTVDFFPATNEVMDLLEWTRAAATLPLQLNVSEHHPQVFDEGKWRPFAGFGETIFQSIGELSNYSFTSEVSAEPALDQLVRSLTEQLPVAAQTMNEVTALKISEGRVSEVIVNGDKALHPETVVFTAFPGLLNTLIEGDGLAAKHRTRLAKMDTWTSVTLELTHSPALSEDIAIRVFNHGAKEFEPVIGRNYGERSLWMTLVPGERGEEHEFIGQCIRHIKRQLKRAWPLDGGGQERIYVQTHAFGQHQLKTKEPFRFPEIRNLYLGNHILGQQPGVLGSLEAARILEQALTGSLSEAPHVEDPSHDQQ
jgi:hypothetical protein